MTTFVLDDREIPFEQGETIIQAATRAGVEIPHYCWHPGLSIAANCRMCLVEVLPPEGQRAPQLDVLQWDATLNDYVSSSKPKLQPACQAAAAPGMVVRSDLSEHVVQARKAVQEFLLLNHPVDCPICDQSGECKLQDYWLAHGRFQKRMREEPVHKPKAVSFGPTIVYDAERCILCTRCIRFMEEVAQDPVLEMRERGNLKEISVSPGKVLGGHYTFMTEHVCPVGALTTKDFRFKARVWFLRTVSSVCQGCATGCNAFLDYDPRVNTVYRYRPRDNEAVNRYWMCDEGMLSYREAHIGRVNAPRVLGEPLSLEHAVATSAKRLQEADRQKLAVVLSAQHSLEDNWAMHRLAQELGVSQCFVTGRADGYEDTILISRDKNSNTRGVQEIAPQVGTWGAFLQAVRDGQVTHVLALGGLTPEEPDESEALRRLHILVVCAAHTGPLEAHAHVVLPACSWAETAGTYVNRLGMHQGVEAALSPMGDSLPGWKLVGLLAKALQVQLSWSTFQELRTLLYKEKSKGLAAKSTPAS